MTTLLTKMTSSDKQRLANIRIPDVQNAAANKAHESDGKMLRMR